MIPLTGCIVSLVTPFHHNRVDYDAFTRILELQIASGVSAVCILDGIGETASLTEDERLSVVQFTVERVEGRVPVGVCAFLPDTSSVINFAKSAEAIGADFIVVTDPYFGKVGQAEMYTHYETILDNIESPVFIRSDESATGNDLMPDTLQSLIKNHGIGGVIECSDDLGRIMDMVCACSGVRFYAGTDLSSCFLYALGAKGVFSTAANIAPEMIRKQYEAWSDGNHASAAEMQMKLYPLFRSIGSSRPSVSVKAMLCEMRLCEDEVRLPLIPIDARERALFSKVLNDLMIL